MKHSGGRNRNKAFFFNNRNLCAGWCLNTIVAIDQSVSWRSVFGQMIRISNAIAYQLLHFESPWSAAEE